MFAIYKKEISSYFKTATGYIFLACALVISGFFFCMNTIMADKPTSDISSYFYIMVLLIVVLCPILTMRSFSEERKTKTEQLLLTSPVSIFSMVIGKFLSAFTMFLIFLGITTIYYIPLFATVANGANSPNGAMLLGNMLALILVGMCFIAIGIFVSALTENMPAAYIITVAILLFLLLINAFNAYIGIEWIRVVLDWLSIYGRFNAFTHGIFDISALIYYLSITGVFLFLCERVFQMRRLG